MTRIQNNVRSRRIFNLSIIYDVKLSFNVTVSFIHILVFNLETRKLLNVIMFKLLLACNFLKVSRTEATLQLVGGS